MGILFYPNGLLFVRDSVGAKLTLKITVKSDGEQNNIPQGSNSFSSKIKQMNQSMWSEVRFCVLGTAKSWMHVTHVSRQDVVIVL